MGTPRASHPMSVQNVPRVSHVPLIADRVSDGLPGACAAHERGWDREGRLEGAVQRGRQSVVGGDVALIIKLFN